MKTATLDIMKHGGLGASLSLLVGVAGLALAAQAADIPMSARSVAAWQKVEPNLGGALKAAGLRLGDPILIRVFKEPAELEVWIDGYGGRYTLFRTYEICDYSGRLGPKLQQGDKQAPEGFYYVTAQQLNPNSNFHLSFDLGFPNPYDRGLGRTGSKLMIHGDCVSVGCYAMTDEGIEEIYTLVQSALRSGQDSVPVHVFPFHMTERAMYRYRRSPWIDFWQNLKQGYDLFERDRRPPIIAVASNRYLLGSGSRRAIGNPLMAEAGQGSSRGFDEIPLRDQIPAAAVSSALSVNLSDDWRTRIEQPIRASSVSFEWDSSLFRAAGQLGVDPGVVSDLFSEPVKTPESLSEPTDE